MQVIYSDRTGPSGGIACPTDKDLLAFAEGALPERLSETIIEHLTQCDRCEMSLARLAEKSSLAGRFRASSAADAVVQEAECQRMQRAIRELPNRAPGARAEPDEESTDKTRLSTDHLPLGRAQTAGEATTAYVPQAQMIGRYQVRSVLGEGGYGQVYLAHDPQLDRQVAIKVAKFGPTVSRRLIDAFLTEAKILAKLKHPGIVAVYDAGFDPAAGCYIVMELVEGSSLKQVMKAGKVSHEQAAKYVAQAAEAVHYAHKQGLVHRDLKPANLLLDADGNIKVADFGLAILEAEQREREGEIAGTLLYSSPEQIRGEAHRLDGRTDIWSLGVILYELLTGRRPFGGPNVTDEILHRPPKPPRQINDTIPLDLERICIKCLAPAAVARYATALDLAKDLQGSPETPGLPRRSKNQWGLLAAAAVLLLMTALATGFAFSRRQQEIGGSTIRSPEVMAWSPYDRHDKYAYDEQNKRFHFDAFGQALFSVARRNEKHVDTQVTFSVRRWEGFGGLFWSLRERPDGTLKCFAVGAGASEPDLPFEVRICEFDIGNVSGGRQGVTSSTTHLPIQNLQKPAGERSVLRVQADDAMVTQIWLNGKPLLESPFKIPSDREPMAGEAKVGFYGYLGDVSVYDFVTH